MMEQDAKKSDRAIYWGIHLSFWVVAFNAVLYFVALFADGGYVLQRTLVLIALNIILFYACYSWLTPVYVQKKKFALAAIVVLLLGTGVTLLRTVGDDILLEKFEWEPAYRFSRQSRLSVMLFAELSFAAFAILLRLAASSYNNKRRMDELRQLQLSTELQFLKAQMSPHFLFNSINNIYSLVLLKSDKAPEALMKLSELLRYSLYDCHGEVSLKQEVEALESYIELFRLKYEEDLKLDFDKNIGEEDFRIEPLLLIPLLENALKYSGIGRNDEAFVSLKLRAENRGLVFQTSNSKGAWFKDEEASGIGLANIRKRLENIYPGRHVLKIQERENLFEVTLEINLP